MLSKSALIGYSAISQESEMPSSWSGALVLCTLEHEPLAVELVAGTRLGGKEVAWRDFVRQLRSGGAGQRIALRDKSLDGISLNILRAK